MVELSARDGKLFMGRQGGPALVPVANDRFRVPGGPLELVFGAGEHAGFERRLVTGGRPMPFEWRASVNPTRSLLSEYAGRYVSDELGGSIYTIAATDSTITVRTGTEEPTHARLMFADTFFADGYTIQFTRERGRVTGFEVTESRMRRVRFDRRDPPR
jgi:hypothetical protein